MAGSSLEALATLGHRLFSTKLFSTSMYCMWVYDYFITLGDEVTYAWSGRKSWVFALFVANRYLPALHILYKGIIVFDFTTSLCEKTKWEVACYTALAALLAQLTVASRLYAVSGRNKLHASVLFVLLSAQSCAGIWLTVVAGTHPIQPLPQINLDAFKVCLVQQWRPGVISFVTIGVAFDAFALVSIFATTGWRNFRRYPGIPSLVTTILRDATMYFFAMFACQLLLLFFLFLAPVQIQLLPGVTHTIFLPMMACRLMLSLKKAASEPRGMWTLTNEGTENGRGIFTDRSLRFGDAPGEISDTTTSPSGGDVELWAVTRSPRR